MKYWGVSRFATVGLIGSLLVAPAIAAGQSGVTFNDIAQDPATGLAFTRAPSGRYAEIVAAQIQSLTDPLVFADLDLLPQAPRGQGGTAVFDYDNDGDLDIYVTNGPGAPNALFQNQLTETGDFRFVDVGAISGAGATDQDSTGVCYGDTDNDGDKDLYVLANNAPNRFLENNGNGTFSEIALSGAEGGNLGGSSCAMADFDNDGLLDIAVANTWDFNDNLALLAVPFALNDPNQLFVNGGKPLLYSMYSAIALIDEPPRHSASDSSSPRSRRVKQYDQGLGAIAQLILRSTCSSISSSMLWVVPANITAATTRSSSTATWGANCPPWLWPITISASGFTSGGWRGSRERPLHHLQNL